MKKIKLFKIFALGSALSAVAGYLTGLMTAPKSGQELREELKQTNAKNLSDLQRDLNNLNQELDSVIKKADLKKTELTEKAGQELQGLVEKTQAAEAKVQEIVEAVRSGDANDEDLKRALKNSKSALEHLKDYLDK